MTTETDFSTGTSGNRPAQGRQPPSRSQEPPAIQINMPKSGGARQGGEPSRSKPDPLDNVEGLLRNLMSRLDDNDRRYGMALENMDRRLNEMSERARTAERSAPAHSAAALDRVRVQADSLAEQINEAGARHKAHRGAPTADQDQRISAVADRIDVTDTFYEDGGSDTHPGPAVNDDFADATQRLERSLAARIPASEFDSLTNRMDDLANRFDAALNSRNNVPALESIESQLNNLTNSFTDARQQHARIEAIESHLHNLMDWANSANAPAGGAPDERLEAIEQAIQALNENARVMDIRTTGTLETMNSTLQSMAKHIDGPAPIETEQKYVRTDGPQEDYAEVWINDGTETGDPPGTLAERPCEPDPNQMGASIPDYQPAPEYPEATADRADQTVTRGNAPMHAEPAFDTENDFIAAARRAAAAADAQGVSARPAKARQNPFTGDTASPLLPDSKRQRPLLVMAAVGLLLVSAGLLYSRLKTAPGSIPGGSRPEQIAPQQSASPPMSPSGTGGPVAPQSSAPQTPGAKKQHSERMLDPDARAPRSETAQSKTVTKPATPRDTRASLPGPSAAIAARATQALTEPNFNQPLSTATLLASLPLNSDAGQMSGVSITIKEPAARTAPRAAAPALVPPGTKHAQPAPIALPKRAPAPSRTARRRQPIGSVDSAPANEIMYPANSIQTGMPPATIGPQSLRMAAARGNPAAQVAIASRYAKGAGIAKDLKKAAEWYGRAASQGYAQAQYRLAALYERGQGVKQDIGMARTWYRRAAELGNVRAMHNLAVLYTQPEGKGADYVIAKNWFYQAARHGLADSQFNLGILYESGLGAQKNIAEAYKWFTLAARQGDKAALKRRELVRPQLSAKTLKAVERVLKTWQQAPVKEAANRTGPPKGGWQNARTKNNSAGSDPALIARAQFLLNKLGYNAGVPDGKMGPKTAAAILRFEGRTGKAKTGKVTPVLLRRLNALSS